MNTQTDLFANKIAVWSIYRAYRAGTSQDNCRGHERRNQRVGTRIAAIQD